MAAKTQKSALQLFENIKEVKKDLPKSDLLKKVDVDFVETNKEAAAKESKPIDSVEEKSSVNIPSEDKPKIILTKKEPKAKNSHTFYFDDEIFDKLTRLAKKNNMTVSEALAEILKQVL